MSEPKQPWHKNTRFWRVGGPMVLSCHLLAFATLIWRPESLGDAFLMVTGVTTVFLGGSSYVKGREKAGGMESQ